MPENRQQFPRYSDETLTDHDITLRPQRPRLIPRLELFPPFQKVISRWGAKELGISIALTVPGMTYGFFGARGARMLGFYMGGFMGIVASFGYCYTNTALSMMEEAAIDLAKQSKLSKDQ